MKDMKQRRQETTDKRDWRDTDTVSNYLDRTKNFKWIKGDFMNSKEK